MKRMEITRQRKIRRIIMMCESAVLLVALLFVCFTIFDDMNESQTVAGESSQEIIRKVISKNEADENNAAAEKRVKLLAIGDMLMHPPVSGYALQPDGSYNYDFIFDPIRSDVSAADLAVVNNEVPFGGNQYGLRNFPAFNCRTELGDAEVKAGFNIILNATNHVNDMGYAGIQNTLKFWENYPDVTLLGVNKTQSEVGALRIVEVNGIKLALFNYTYGINAGMPKEAPFMVDLLTADTQEKIKNELARAEQEADFTIVFPHWGYEYHLVQSGVQETFAKFFTECGADLIIGTHPHCIQPIRTITAANGNKALCYYSLGNYISEQDETIAMIGGIAQVEIVKDDAGTRIYKNDIRFVITHYGEAADKVRVYRLEDYSDDLARQHGIVLRQWNGGELNFEFPFNMNSIQKIIANMKSEHPKETDLVHIEQRPKQKTTTQPLNTAAPETDPVTQENNPEPEPQETTETNPPETSTEPPTESTEPPTESTEAPTTAPPETSGEAPG